MDFGTNNFMRIDVETRSLVQDNTRVSLRNKEFDLLVYFLDNIGKLLTRAKILEDVWEKSLFCTTNTIDVHVSTLRQKIRKFCDREFIRTVHCIGYIFET